MKPGDKVKFGSVPVMAVFRYRGQLFIKTDDGFVVKAKAGKTEQMWIGDGAARRKMRDSTVVEIVHCDE
jgi:hypothetical protein